MDELQPQQEKAEINRYTAHKWRDVSLTHFTLQNEFESVSLRLLHFNYETYLILY
jgi:hypothetical protein